MKPINEKERTLAFVQFLVLFILTVILTIFFVFFDTKIIKKDYEVLKEENKLLKGNLITSSDLPSQIDSLLLQVKNFKNISETEYEGGELSRFNNDLSQNFNPAKGDSTELGRIRLSVSKVLKELSYTLGSTIREKSKNEKIKQLEADIKQMEQDMDDLKEKFDNYKTAHP